MKVRIRYSRLGKPDALYTEGFVSDDRVRLRTSTVVPLRISQRWSREWQAQKLLRPGQLIGLVRKNHFYDQYFSIMELRSYGGIHLGYYCDVTTPLACEAGQYHVVDLFLDLWIAPDGSLRELDLDEFSAACESGLVTPDLAQAALSSFAGMKAEAAEGLFPGKYIR